MDDELKHYGVLGMKWGVRKDNKPQGYGNPGNPGHSGKTQRKINRATRVRSKVDSGKKQLQGKADRLDKSVLKSKEKDKTRKVSRRDARNHFFEQKANDIIKRAMADPEILVAISNGAAGVAPTVITGEQFILHLSAGGSFNVPTSDVFAVKNKDGQYEQQQLRRYKKGATI